MSKKWTSWIDHTGDECPVDGDEVVRVQPRWGVMLKPRNTGSAATFKWIKGGLNSIKFYKRLLSNVKAEKKAKPSNPLFKSSKQAREWIESLPQEPTQALKDLYDAHVIPASDEEAAALDVSRPGQECDATPQQNVIMSQSEQDAQNQEAIEATQKLAATNNPVGEECTPQPIITKEGDYRTSSGIRAKVTYRSQHGDQRYYGWILDQHCSWDADGSYHGDLGGGADIIGPWVEAEAEVWIAVYRGVKQQLWMGGRKEASAEKIHQSNTQTANYCGALNLSHTEGES